MYGIAAIFFLLHTIPFLPMAKCLGGSHIKHGQQVVLKERCLLLMIATFTGMHAR